MTGEAYINKSDILIKGGRSLDLNRNLLLLDSFLLCFNQLDTVQQKDCKTSIILNMWSNLFI